MFALAHEFKWVNDWAHEISPGAKMDPTLASKALEQIADYIDTAENPDRSVVASGIASVASGLDPKNRVAIDLLIHSLKKAIGKGAEKAAETIFGTKVERDQQRILNSLEKRDKILPKLSGALERMRAGEYALEDLFERNRDALDLVRLAFPVENVDSRTDISGVLRQVFSKPRNKVYPITFRVVDELMNGLNYRSQERRKNHEFLRKFMTDLERTADFYVRSFDNAIDRSHDSADIEGAEEIRDEQRDSPGPLRDELTPGTRPDMVLPSYDRDEFPDPTGRSEAAVGTREEKEVARNEPREERTESSRSERRTGPLRDDLPLNAPSPEASVDRSESDVDELDESEARAEIPGTRGRRETRPETLRPDLDETARPVMTPPTSRSDSSDVAAPPESGEVPGTAGGASLEEEGTPTGGESSDDESQKDYVRQTALDIINEYVSKYITNSITQIDSYISGLESALKKDLGDLVLYVGYDEDKQKMEVFVKPGFNFSWSLFSKGDKYISRIDRVRLTDRRGKLLQDDEYGFFKEFNEKAVVKAWDDFYGSGMTDAAGNKLTQTLSSLGFDQVKIFKNEILASMGVQDIILPRTEDIKRLGQLFNVKGDAQEGGKITLKHVALGEILGNKPVLKIRGAIEILPPDESDQGDSGEDDTTSKGSSTPRIRPEAPAAGFTPGGAPSDIADSARDTGPDADSASGESGGQDGPVVLTLTSSGNGFKRGRKWTFKGKKGEPVVVKIGRKEGNDLLIQNDKISKNHAQISIENGMIRLQDLGSTNGTGLNGTQVGNDPVAVADGATIQLPSDIKFKVKITRESASEGEPSSGESA